ncbi:PE-PPE domain-containing protein [Mycobacterium sp.]|uniref:PE-PPE domain-containing protein n=1 Tax=Mycobacterium sp. TaxID=1785 RepID=UPI003BB0D037
MKKAILSTLFAAPTLMAGAACLTPTHSVQHLDYKLVDEAMVIIPVENQEFADAAAQLYLQPSGFHLLPDFSNVSTLNMPEVVSGGTLDDAVSQGEQQLVNAIVADYHAGDFGEGNPLYVFGYSQSDVVMGDAEQQLAADGIPQQDLDFVMVGDSASAEGGFLNTYIDSFPSWLQPWVTDAFQEFGAGDVLGATTPTGLYATQVYSLSGDGWANYDNGLNDGGMYSDHLEYLGLTPQEIGTALTAGPTVDGVGQYATEYFTIQDSMVNSLEALWTQLQIADSVLF